MRTLIAICRHHFDHDPTKYLNHTTRVSVRLKSGFIISCLFGVYIFSFLLVCFVFGHITMCIFSQSKVCETMAFLKLVYMYIVYFDIDDANVILHQTVREIVGFVFQKSIPFL